MHGWRLDQTKRWALQLQVLALKQGTREVWVLKSVILIKYSEARIGQNRLCAPVMPDFHHFQFSQCRGPLAAVLSDPGASHLLVFHPETPIHLTKFCSNINSFLSFETMFCVGLTFCWSEHTDSPTSVFFTLLTSWYIFPPSLHLSVNHSYLKKMAKDLQFPI